jgi:hypothetical protein
MLQRTMAGFPLPVLMAMRSALAAGLRETIRETLSVQRHQRDREEYENSTPAPHFSPA